MKIKTICKEKKLCNIKDCKDCKIDDFIYRINKETNTINAMYEFLKLTKEDFDLEPQPIVLNNKNTRLLIDFVKSIDHNLDIQCWQQFSLWLTYNHIWCNYEVIHFIITKYLNKLIQKQW